MTIQAIFFDDGGVMNDNNVRSPQWNKLIADYFTPRYGGEKENWMKANVHAMTDLSEILNDILENHRTSSYQEYIMKEHQVWVEKMFEFMGITPPPIENYEKLYDEANNWVIPQVRSTYPGIVDTIRYLSKTFALHTASNESSSVLDLYLQSMKVRKYFQILFGPDLIEVMKSNQLYYERIFSYAEIKAEKVIIIDDNPNILKQAQKTNASVIQSCLDGQQPELDYYFTKTSELPGEIERLQKKG